MNEPTSRPSRDRHDPLCAPRSLQHSAYTIDQIGAVLYSSIILTLRRLLHFTISAVKSMSIEFKQTDDVETAIDQVVILGCESDVVLHHRDDIHFK